MGVIAASSKSDVHRLEIRLTGTDPRARTLLHDACDLGITSIDAIDVIDVYFIHGILDKFQRLALEHILVDSLLQQASWKATATTCHHFVETALHAGVTDAASQQLLRIASRLGISVDAVTTAKRIEIVGAFKPGELDLLVRKLLANPVIEYWSVDSLIIPVIPAESRAHVVPVEVVPIAVDATDEQLLKLNGERG